jgi:hypothetical protein
MNMNRWSDDEPVLTPEERRKNNAPVWRLTGAVCACLFGCLWLAMMVAREIAPPEPEFAFRMRHLCLLLFLLSAAWCGWLLAGWRRETRKKGTGSE